MKMFLRVALAALTLVLCTAQRYDSGDPLPPPPPPSCQDVTVPDPSDSLCFYTYHCDGTFTRYCF